MVSGDQQPRSANFAGQRGLTRRGLLVGAGHAAGATLAGGSLAARFAPWRDWWDRLAAEVDPSGRFLSHETTVRTASLRSRYVQDPVDYAIAWPPGVSPGTPLPVCFCLPGRGGGPPMGIAADVARAVRRGRVPPYALAGIAGGVSYWHLRASGEDRLSMLLKEFIPLCARHYHLGGRRHRRAIIGWSMGGYGALLAAETKPNLFAAVVAVSPAVWTSYDAMMLGPRDAFDDAADFARHDVIAHADRLAATRLRIDCGTSDPFYGYVTHLRAALSKPAAGGYGPGGHNPAYFERVAPAEVEFIGRAFA
jgi:enterochelin esterase-like enzyme